MWRFRLVKGLAEFNRRWAAVPKAVRVNTRAVMEDQANKIVDEMYTLAPQDTGDLAGSISWTWGEAPKGTLVIGTVGGQDYGALRITIYAGGDDAFYARFQEFGTRKMPANPFFFPVWRVRKRRVKSAITREINKAIKNS